MVTGAGELCVEHLCSTWIANPEEREKISCGRITKCFFKHSFEIQRYMVHWRATFLNEYEAVNNLL